ncbi:DNA mismatch repair protein [Chitinophaga sp. 30R24]|uniref:MutS-related protein n=1 Tax=Chitinophaga sp. 30R24 TaxID=3248838 RepID=UPI003B90A288
MLFTTDNQTLEDLSIFGRQEEDSVYGIFHHTYTRGGTVLLEEMFRYPLSDEAAINRRSGIIQYFAANGTVFPFSPVLLDAAESYLANVDERSQLTDTPDTIGKKISQLIASDGDTVFIYKGINALVELLHGMRDFIGSLSIPEGHGYQADKEAIWALLSAPDLVPVLTPTHKGKPPHAVMVEYDGLFRFRCRKIMQALLRHIYYIDVYLAVAKVALERGFSFPAAQPRHQHMVKLEGVYHPLLKQAVANTIEITPGNNVIFLTGANMAGKSTFMKSLSIALYLAHMGFPVPAAHMVFSVLDGIYTTINLPDNLGMGASHFYAEVLRVKKIANELSQGKSLFVLFDELFRGTNVKDAYEATVAITRAFANKRNSLFVVSTHIMEAGEALRQHCSNVRFVYLPTRMNGNTPVYTYLLENGITDDRHGMVIINQEGILEILKSGIANTTK